MSILSLLGFGERKKKVLKYLDQGALIIDIRMPEEFEEEHIDGSINMIQDDLELELDKIRDFGKPVLLCCATGLRSDEGAVLLRDEGIDAINAGTYDRLKKLNGK